MPVLSKIVDVDGYQLLDGGIADSIPLRYFQGLGYERNLVVLTQPSLYRKTPLKMQWLIEKRLAKAEEELSYKPYFDRVVVNDDLHHAFEQLDAIIDEH